MVAASVEAVAVGTALAKPRIYCESISGIVASSQVVGAGSPGHQVSGTTDPDSLST